MPTQFDWRNYGKDFPEVNKNLNGLPDWLVRILGSGKEKTFGTPGLAPFSPLAAGAVSLAAPAAASLAIPAAAAYGLGKLIAPKKTEEAVKKIKGFAEKTLNKASALGSAYETGMAESIPGAKFAKKLLLKPEHQKYLEEIKAQHPLAAKAGTVGGTVGMMALPGAAIAKGGSLAAVAANAALNAAPIALGTGLDVGSETGSIGKGITAGLLSQGLGTLAPVGITALTRIPGVQTALARLQSSAAGIRPRDIFKVLKGRAKQLRMSPTQADAYMMKKAPDLITKVADKVDEFGYGPAGKRAFKKWSNEGFEAHAKLFDQATGGRLSADDMVAISQDADILPIKARFGEQAVDDEIQRMASEIDGQGWTNSRSTLSKYSQAGSEYVPGLAMNDPRRLSSQVAEVMRDRIDSVAGNLAEAARNAGQTAIPELDMLKATYPAVLAQQSAGARAAGQIPVGEGGSPTAARLLLHRLLPNIGMGGATAGILTPDMIKNPKNIPADVMKILLISALGKYVTQGGAGLARGIGGRAAGMLRGFGPQAATVGARAGALLPTAGRAETPVPVSESPEASAEQATARVEAAEQAAPEKVEEAKAEVNQAWRDRILEQIQADWENLNYSYPGHGISFEDFIAEVDRQTNGFDPKASAVILFRDPKERENYLQTYEQALAVGRMDIPRALAYGKTIIGTERGGEEAALQRKSHDDLVSLMASIIGGPEKIADRRIREVAEQDLENLKKLKLPPEAQRMALLDLLRTNYGLDLDMLNQYGITV